MVEDELSIQKLYRMVLEAYGFKIIGTAKNGEEAVEIYKTFSKTPDLIIMDHRMPIKNGIEASKEILQLDRDAKIIIASADNTVKEYYRSIGALSFISKPFSNQTLIKEINKVLRHTTYQKIQKDVTSRL
ncbi:MAG: response regulator [Promethearchaeota archaeon]